MNLVITGGAGFIGSHFIRQHLENHPNDRVICFDSLTYAGNRDKLRDIENKDNFKFIKGDITDKESVNSLFIKEKPDILINFAAETHVDRSITNPFIFTKTNTLGVVVLLDACLKYGIKLFHQISTDEVYGSLQKDDIRGFSETSPLNPSSPYSASKAAADLLVLSYNKTFSLPVNISRLSNNFGPFQNLEKLIPLVIKNAKADLNIPIYGTGKNQRDWLYVIDACQAIEAIISKGRIGEIYNISAHNEVSNIKLVKNILYYLNKPESLISYVADRPGHDIRYSLETVKIEKQLKWYPKYEFYEALKETIESYK